MKKLLAVMLFLAMLLSLAACGGEPDPNLGIYKAVACSVLGFEQECEGDFVELKAGGKTIIRLMGEDYRGKWSLEGETLTITQQGSEFAGRLSPGAMYVDFSGMEYTYLMDGAEISALCGLEGHKSTESNYQDEGICTVCGEVTAEKLIPEMVQWGMTEFMEQGKTYELETITGEDAEISTIGLVSVESYEVFESAEGYEALEGYEWRVVKFACEFRDDNAWEYGFWINSRLEDYYTTTLHEDSNVVTYSADEEMIAEYTVNWHGQEMPATEHWSTESAGWQKDENGEYHNIRYFTYAVRVPVGYDGGVFAVYDYGIAVDLPEEESWYIYEKYSPEDMLMFRLK